MKFGDITKRLSGKQSLKEAKTNEDLDRPRTSDKALLTEDQLGSVAGGGGPLAFRPERCPRCGGVLDPFFAGLRSDGCMCAELDERFG
ncbi:MAG: hypothetical protein IKO68_04655 [Oscillospiraceae bacterium]|nr:hypothetical protein [Oscillospiraceae bacterium]